MSKATQAFLTGFMTLLAMIAGSEALIASELEFNSQIRRFESQPRAVAVDPDGRHLYVTHPSSDSISIYRIDPAGGGLDFVALLRDGENGIDRMEDPTTIIVSPDGRHVYVACYDDNSLIVFSRERGSGHLVYVGSPLPHQTHWYGPYGPSDLAMSGDGKYLFVTEYDRDGVMVYSRDIGSGDLTFTDRKQNFWGDVWGMRRPVSVGVSPDGNSVYVASGTNHSLVAFSHDRPTGKLSFQTTYRNSYSGIHGMSWPSDIALSNDGMSLYVTGSGDDAVVQFEREVASGLLTYVDTLWNGGGDHNLDRPSAIVVSGDGSGVVVAAQVSGALVVLHRDHDSGHLTYVESHVNGVDGVNGMEDPVSLVSGPGDAYLYLGSYSDGGLPVFEYNAQAGTASFLGSDHETPEVRGLKNMPGAAFTSDGKHLYVAALGADSVVAMGCDPSTGHLSFLQDLKNGEQGVEGIDGASAVALSPDGATVYVAGMDSDAIGVFDRDPVDGVLSYIGAVRDGVDGVDGLRGVEGLAVSPDGDHLYAAGMDDDALVVFDRDGLSGDLTFKEVHRDGIDGANGLNGAIAVVVSPDGHHIYVAAFDEKAVSAFARDPETGSATFFQIQKQGSGDIFGLQGPAKLALSLDGLNLYVAAAQSDSIAVFARDPLSGELSFVDALVDGVDGVDGLAATRAVVVSPDGTRVFASSSEDFRVASFVRDVSGGGLRFLNSVRTRYSGSISPPGIHPGYLTMSPDGLYVYVFAADGAGWADWGDDSIMGLRRWQRAADGVPEEIQVIDGRQSRAIDVEPCAEQLRVDLTGLSGNLDLSTRFGELPTATEFDCRSDQSGAADEQCVHAAPSAGRWWVNVEAPEVTDIPIDATLTATVQGCEGYDQVSWWRANGDADDALGLNDGIAEGGLGYGPAILDQAFVMAANGDSVVVPSDVSLEAGESDFSYSMWVQTTDRRPFRSLLDSRTVDPVSGFQLFLDHGRPGAQIADGSGVTTVVGGKDLADGRFHHLTVAVDRDSPQGLTLWVDRKIDTKVDPSQGLGPVMSLEGVTFGRRTDATSGEGFFNGLIDEVRFVQRAIPRREAVDVFGGLRSWWPGDGESSDHGGVNHAVGSPSYIQGRRGLGFRFDEAPDDHLVVPHNPSLDFGTADLTIVCWVKTEQSTGEQIVLDSRTAGSVGFALAVVDGKPKLYFADADESAAFSVDRPVADGDLHHLVVTIDRDSPEGISFWVDGELVETFDPTAVAGSIDSGGGLTIGRRAAVAGITFPFHGIVDELELYERVLTETEIGWLFDDSTGLFFLDSFELEDLSGWSGHVP